MIFEAATSSSDGLVHLTLGGSTVALLADRLWSSFITRRKNGNGHSTLNEKDLELLELRITRSIVDGLNTSMIPVLTKQTEALVDQTKAINQLTQSVQLENELRKLQRMGKGAGG